MLFGKKKHKEKKEVPVDEIQKMTKKGMSDKDIIKHLKSKGYSYESIESAMLKAVKDGVSEEEPKVEHRIDTAPPAADNFFNEEFSPDAFQQPGLPDLPPAPQEDLEAPELMLEELVEGIVDEKWRKVEDKFKTVDDSFDKIKSEIKQFELHMDQIRKDSPEKEFETKIVGITEQLEDLESRVGGLEKAFKQFLPSLTRNIESLSSMIHEMKDKQTVTEV